MELNYKIQTYEWGKKGKSSKVATLNANNNSAFKIEEDTPYSELWLGTHVNGPSTLKNGKLLSDFIANQPLVLGANVRMLFGDQLPFLFKILSVGKALSIQAHPSKSHAEQLHRDLPDIYKDPNHKPELAIALTPFEALCGFRPVEQVKYFLENIPELRNLIPVEVLQNSECDLLKKSLKAVLTSPSVPQQLQNLIRRLKTLSANSREKQLAELIERLHGQYPNDVGCFVAYFLNYLQLKPSEAIYLGANVPHAYLQGDCVECMACSDNVVRAGLTSKHIDVETLCNMLIYKGQSAESNLFQPIQEDTQTKLYKPPVVDFAVAQIVVNPSLKTYTTIKRNSASILLVVEGKGSVGKVILKPGVALFIPAEEVVQIIKVEEDLIMYQGLANV